ncbi:MAG TPA: manganese efflux pump MntP family protein [Bacteroidales bacterium]
MGIITILLIAFGLSFDTFAVSVSSGLILRKINFYNAMKIAFVLAFFQGFMPMIGWFIGSGVKKYMMTFDHWIAFILLTVLGTKMIYESFRHDKDHLPINPMRFTVMVSLAIATSIDALIVGLSFAFFKVNIFITVFLIGAVTFIVSMLGILFGKKAGAHLGQRMEIVGGLILIAIGIKILIEHQFFS